MAGVNKKDNIAMNFFGRTAFLTLTLGSLALPIAIGGSVSVHAQAAAPAAQGADAMAQVALTDKQVQGLLAAHTELDALTDKLPDTAAKPDPKVQAQMDSIAKKYGFANYAEYGVVFYNIGLVMSGIDPQTKAFAQPPEALKKQIAAVQSDAKMPAKDKKSALDEMNAALKTTPNVQFPENVTLVTKYYDKLSVLQDAN
jgi:hypothetical protein